MLQAKIYFYIVYYMHVLQQLGGDLPFAVFGIIPDYLILKRLQYDFKNLQ